MGCGSLNGMESKCLSVRMAWVLTARRTTHPIVNSEGCVIGLLAGQLQDAAAWERLSKQAADAIEKLRARCVFTAKQQDHRHGAFPNAVVGIIHGNDTQVSPTKHLYNKLT